MNNRVDLWHSETGGILKLIGGRESFQEASDLLEQTCRDYPRHNVTLRQSARVLREQLPPQPTAATWSELPFTEADRLLARETAEAVLERYMRPE